MHQLINNITNTPSKYSVDLTNDEVFIDEKNKIKVYFTQEQNGQIKFKMTKQDYKTYIFVIKSYSHTTIYVSVDKYTLKEILNISRYANKNVIIKLNILLKYGTII